jgi:hypothetical protein
MESTGGRAPRSHHDHRLPAIKNAWSPNGRTIKQVFDRLGDAHRPTWRLLVEQPCKLLVDQPAAEATAHFLTSWNVQISAPATVIASRYRIQTPVALDIAQDYDP